MSACQSAWTKAIRAARKAPLAVGYSCSWVAWVMVRFPEWVARTTTQGDAGRGTESELRPRTTVLITGLYRRPRDPTGSARPCRSPLEGRPPGARGLVPPPEEQALPPVGNLTPP